MAIRKNDTRSTDERLRDLMEEMDLIEHMLHNLQVERARIELRMRRILDGHEDGPILRIDAV